MADNSYVCVLLVVFVVSIASSVGNSITFAQKKIQFAVFSQFTSMRVHDNPCLHHDAATTTLIPVMMLDSRLPYVKSNAIRGIASKLNDTVLLTLNGNIEDTLPSLINYITGCNGNIVRQDISVKIIADNPDHNIKAIVQKLSTALGDASIHIDKVSNGLVSDDAYIDSISYSDHKQHLYNRIASAVKLTLISQSIASISKDNLLKLIDGVDANLASIVDCTHTSSTASDSGDGSDDVGEDVALAIVQEYIKNDDIAFTSKYAEQFINSFHSSSDHKLSLQRLNRQLDSSSMYASYFQGEVVSALLAPHLQQGYLSPKVLIHAKTLFRSRASMLVVPLIDRLQIEAVRKDFHRHLANKAMNVDKPVSADWHVKHTSYKGYLVRYGSMPYTPLSTDTKVDAVKSIFLVHGFGGSIDQYTSVARLLASNFNVYAIDLLGFGESEKPPVSYNQYLWRDQLLYMINKIVADDNSSSSSSSSSTDIVIAGNSIGGFIAAAAAASADTITAGTVKGLVLMNSAGIVEDNPIRLHPVATSSLFNVYKGPSSELLRVVGSVLFVLLQPNILRICEWLYPSNKKAASANLAKNILRDSKDLGASDVIASGGKLPPSESFNSLLSKYKGHVLVAQGAVDPLNDAKDRAVKIGNIRENITVELFPSLGHCPFDEDPSSVARSITAWAKAI